MHSMSSCLATRGTGGTSRQVSVSSQSFPVHLQVRPPGIFAGKNQVAGVRRRYTDGQLWYGKPAGLVTGDLDL